MSAFPAQFTQQPSDHEEEDNEYIELSDKTQIKAYLKAREISEAHQDSILKVIDEPTAAEQKAAASAALKKDKPQFIQDDRQREAPVRYQQKKAQNQANQPKGNGDNYNKGFQEKDKKTETKDEKRYNSKSKTPEKEHTKPAKVEYVEKKRYLQKEKRQQVQERSRDNRKERQRDQSGYHKKVAYDKKEQESGNKKVTYIEKGSENKATKYVPKEGQFKEKEVKYKEKREKQGRDKELKEKEVKYIPKEQLFKPRKQLTIVNDEQIQIELLDKYRWQEFQNLIYVGKRDTAVYVDKAEEILKKFDYIILRSFAIYVEKAFLVAALVGQRYPNLKRVNIPKQVKVKLTNLTAKKEEKIQERGAIDIQLSLNSNSLDHNHIGYQEGVRRKVEEAKQKGNDKNLSYNQKYQQKNKKNYGGFHRRQEDRPGPKGKRSEDSRERELR